MSDFWLYLSLGFNHVLDLNAYDHVLFLIALCATATFDSWRKLLILVSLFTLGHTISLVLGHYDLISVNSTVIECLIPVTIVLTALYNLVRVGKMHRSNNHGLLYFFTVFFGLIHGFGFAGYYKMISPDNALLPLLEFALGVELSQIVVVLAVLIVAFVTQRIFRFTQRDWILVISAIVIGLVIPMLAGNCFTGIFS